MLLVDALFAVGEPGDIGKDAHDASVYVCKCRRPRCPILVSRRTWYRHSEDQECESESRSREPGALATEGDIELQQDDAQGDSDFIDASVRLGIMQWFYRQIRSLATRTLTVAGREHELVFVWQRSSS